MEAEEPDTPTPILPTLTNTPEPTSTPEPTNTPTPTETPMPAEESATEEEIDPSSEEENSNSSSENQPESFSLVDYENKSFELVNSKPLIHVTWDDLGDPFDCTTGEPITVTSSINFEPDIIGASFDADEEIQWSSTGEAGPGIEIKIVTPRGNEGFSQEFSGGLMVTDPRREMADDPETLNDGYGNTLFTFFYNPNTGEELTLTGLVESGEWTPWGGVHNFEVTEMGHISLAIPTEWLHVAENPFLFLTDGKNCDNLIIPPEILTAILINDPPKPVQGPPADPTWPAAPANSPGLFEPAENYMNGGTFAATRKSKAHPNQILVDFALNRNVACQPDNLKMVTTFHVRKDDAPNEILQNYQNGALGNFVQAQLFLEGIGDQVDPTRGINGINVDAPPRRLNDKMWIDKNIDPKWPSSKVKGDKITATDAPQFLDDGFTAYFETAVLCYEGDSFKVLGSMRWANRNPHEVWIIPNPDGNIDWGAPTQGMVDAINRFQTGE